MVLFGTTENLKLLIMGKIVRHSWGFPLQGSKIPQYICSKCLCKKGYSPSFGRVIYIDRFGKIYYRTPSCVLPNTKINKL